MHILIVTDQHPETLGGAQVSISLQRVYLERAGHHVTIVAPELLTTPHEHTTPTPVDDPLGSGAVISLPAFPLTKQRDYAASWPGTRNVRRVLQELAAREPVDLVHVQGDFWGALLGYQLAHELRVPVVNTMHNNLEVGTRTVTRLSPLVFGALTLSRALWLNGKRRTSGAGRGGWGHLRALAERSDAVVAPSTHFARELARHGVTDEAKVIPTGVDDDLIDFLTMVPRAPIGGATRFVWVGRMSPEKRLMEFLRAVEPLHERGFDITVDLVGSGLLLHEATKFVAQHHMHNIVVFHGHLSHEECLSVLYRADVLVQTSQGFETQGMTPFEAIALGTPVIFSDENIANDVNAAPSWRVPDGTVEALTSTLMEATEEIRSGKILGTELRVPHVLGNEHRQSQRTAELIELYERVLKDHGER